MPSFDISPRPAPKLRGHRDRADLRTDHSLLGPRMQELAVRERARVGVLRVESLAADDKLSGIGMIGHLIVRMGRGRAARGRARRGTGRTPRAPPGPGEQYVEAAVRPAARGTFLLPDPEEVPDGAAVGGDRLDQVEVPKEQVEENFAIVDALQLRFVTARGTDGSPGDAGSTRCGQRADAGTRTVGCSRVRRADPWGDPSGCSPFGGGP